MEKMRVRPLTGADRGAVEMIVRHSSEFIAEEAACAMEVVDGAIEGGNREEDYAALCAEAQGAGVVGFICYGKTPLTRSTYDLYWIAVDPSRRGRGAGVSLLRRLEEILKERRATLLVAETSSLPAYARARAFYERQGFHKESVIRGYYGPGDDMLIYCKRFSA